jgi:hypothetical protein
MTSTTPNIRLIDRVCGRCGDPFQVTAHQIEMAGGRYCGGLLCAHGKIARRRLPFDAAGMFTVGWGVDLSREPVHGIINGLFGLGEYTTTASPPCAHFAKPTDAQGAEKIQAVPRKPGDSTQLASRMTMRQHFAGQAMQGYIASMHRCPECGPSEPVEFASAIARDCVRMADALVDALKEPRP